MSSGTSQFDFVTVAVNRNRKPEALPSGKTINKALAGVPSWLTRRSTTSAAEERTVVGSNRAGVAVLAYLAKQPGMELVVRWNGVWHCSIPGWRSAGDVNDTMIAGAASFALMVRMLAKKLSGTVLLNKKLKRRHEFPPNMVCDPNPEGR